MLLGDTSKALCSKCQGSRRARKASRKRVSVKALKLGQNDDYIHPIVYEDLSVKEVSDLSDQLKGLTAYSVSLRLFPLFIHRLDLFVHSSPTILMHHWC